MKVKVFIFAGLILAALTALATASPCYSDNAQLIATRSNVSSMTVTFNANSDDAHECHHHGKTSHQSIVAWLRTSDDCVRSKLDVPQRHVSLLSKPLLLATLIEARGSALRLRPRESDVQTGFFDMHARNGRILI
jgi:hypothetical protein